jgi:hypothetical protein
MVRAPGSTTSPRPWRAPRSCSMVAVCPRPPNLTAPVGDRCLSPRLGIRLASSTSAPALPSTRHTSSPWPAGRPDLRPRSLLRSPVPRRRWMRSHAQWTRCAASSSASVLLRVLSSVGDSATTLSSSTSASLSRATRSTRHVARSPRAARQSGRRRLIGDEPKTSRQASRSERSWPRAEAGASAGSHNRDTPSARPDAATRRRVVIRTARSRACGAVIRRPAQLSCDSRDGCVPTRRSWSSWSRSSCMEPSSRSLERRARATSSSRSFRLLCSIISFLSGVRGGSAPGAKRSRLGEWTTARVAPSGATRVRWIRLLSCAGAGAAGRRRRRAVRASGRPA